MNIVEEREKIVKRFETSTTKHNFLFNYAISIVAICIISLIFPIKCNVETKSGILLIIIEAVGICILSTLLMLSLSKKNKANYKELHVVLYIFMGAFAKIRVDNNSTKSYVICYLITFLISMGILCFYFNVFKFVCIILILVASYLTFKYINIKDLRVIMVIINFLNFYFNAKDLSDKIDKRSYKEEDLLLSKILLIVIFVVVSILFGVLYK